MHIELRPRPRTQTVLRVVESQPVRQPNTANVNPVEWHQSQGLARQACARIFRDGGRPADALQAFGLDADPNIDWSRAVERIALAIARPGMRSAA